jgi:DNA-binding response OmpR family regulator
MSEIERLRDRVEELEGLLGLHLNLPNELGLTPLELKYIGFLMRKEIANQDMILTAVYGGLPECDQPNLKTIEVHICKIRKKLRAKGLSIKSRYNVGYYLEDSAKEALKKFSEIRFVFGRSDQRLPA